MAATSDVYRTERGTVLRIIRSAEGGVRVELLQDDAWVRGPIGMVGLRLSQSTTRLTAAAIRALPA